jgi:hypothetical protein
MNLQMDARPIRFGNIIDNDHVSKIMSKLSVDIREVSYNVQKIEMNPRLVEHACLGENRLIHCPLPCYHDRFRRRNSSCQA